jgi:N-terminal domain of Peptidase_S41 in eukaryotic IRBP/Peptidase family S41
MGETDKAPPLYSPHEIVEALIQRLGENYVFPEKAREIAATLRRQLEQGAYMSMNGEALARSVTEQMRGVAQDTHLAVFYHPGGAWDYVDDDETYTPKAVEQMRQTRRYNYGLRKVEVLDGNIGYFQLDEFVHPEVAGHGVHAAMTFLAHTRALIMDLRANSGGDETMVQLLCSFFFDPFKGAHIQLNGLYDRRRDLLR